MLRHRTPRGARSRASLGALGIIAIVAAVLAGGLFLSARPGPSPAPPFADSPIAAATTPPAPATATPTPPPATPVATPRVSATPSAATARAAIVPIVEFWSGERSLTRAALADALRGAANRPVFVSAADLPALAAALGVTPSGVQTLAPADLKSKVRSTKNALGFIRADDVTPDVRALAVGGVSLFGAQRVKDLGSWPLVVNEAGSPSFQPRALWTIAAGGDVMLDKDVYRQAIANRKGVDYPWQGGTARISGRTCCGWGGPKLVNGTRTGNAGAVSSIFRSADLALANLEAPVSDHFTYHSTGFSFSADPELLAGLKHAGIDGVSLANNHLGNAGTQAILDTLHHLDEQGISHVGAGVGQPAARKAMVFTAGGRRIAVLAYSDIQPESYWAAPGKPGSAAYSIGQITADIKAAQSAGATFVIVMPHWGKEYTDSLYDFQRPDARAMVKAGADLILGSHSHWVGSMETIDGHLVFYSLGDLVFDWTHDERTQEGAIADLTFDGARLVQIDLHPTIILDGGQPNLLDPAGDGRVVLVPVQQSTGSRLGW